MNAQPPVAAAVFAILAAALSGCASTSAEGAFRDMASAVEQRSGQKVRWNQGSKEDKEVAATVRAMLKDELSADAAVQIALLNNRGLQATYEELSVAQAELVQAGLLRNPVFDASALFPLAGGAPTLDLGVELDFLGILMLPARKKLAASALEAAKTRVGAAVLDLAWEVRVSYLTLQAAQQVVAMRRTIAEAAQISAELTTRQEEAGTMSALDQASEQSLYEQVRLDLARSEGEMLDARERLTRLLGLWGPSTAWRIPDRLPDVPASDPPLEHVESLAIRQRLDIEAARHEVQTAAHRLSIARSGRFLGGADVGAVAEREHGEWGVGPSAQLELPIFDQGQGSVAALEAEMRASEHRLAALAVDARSEVRSARNRVVLARRIAEHYRKVLIPLRERVVALSQQQYDAMLLGVYQLLTAKQAEVDTYREYIEAVRDYWIAWTELERAAGGRIPRPGGGAQTSTAKPSPAAPAPAPAPAPDGGHHHH